MTPRTTQRAGERDDGDGDALAQSLGFQPTWEYVEGLKRTIEQQQARMKRVESHVESCNATHCRMLHKSLNQNPPNPRSTP